MQSHNLILTSAAHNHPQLDALVDPLEKTLTARTKSDAVKQEVSRQKV